MLEYVEGVSQHFSEGQHPVATQEPKLDLKPNISPAIEIQVDFNLQNTQSIEARLKRGQTVTVDPIDAEYLSEVDSDITDPYQNYKNFKPPEKAKGKLKFKKTYNTKPVESEPAEVVLFDTLVEAAA